jgi:hypothetical protein
MNNMNEHQFANSIRRALNEGAQLKPAIAERLRNARARALERRRLPQQEAAPAFAWAGSVLGSFGGIGGFSLRFLAPAVLLVAGLVAIYGGQQEQRAQVVEELDALLLTDDLPIDAYLDRGFEAWLKKARAANGDVSASGGE